MFDRNRQTYSGGVIPVDEPVAGPTIRANFVPGSSDVVIEAATRWLLARPECTTVSPESPSIREGGRMVPTRPMPGTVPGSAWPKDKPTPWRAISTRF
jgi:hypothetical protein